jgi:hypothetical protein
MKSFYLLGIALASRFDCLTERMATDSKETDRRIGATLLFHVPAVFYEEIPRYHLPSSSRRDACTE